ncbi:hypothetical protein TWF694_004485 [Orbilia ellipsospora]|uniref:NmrA-like domain-containing protein n=1 Tax=Orbilia ellipsospora TaxID=2528407 RepID=A0AAV9WVF4_9PEZI
MSKLLTVIGGTGTQGLSLINEALKDGKYKIRALTRNTNSSKAKALASKGVEVVQADINDKQSLVRAFEGSHAIYGITDFFEPFGAHGPQKAIEIETAQGINIAKAAAETSTLEHYIWSTLPNAGKATNGKYMIPHFVAKNNVDDYIRSDKSLLAKTTFLWITWYVNNYQYPVFTPIYVKSSKSYIQLSPAASDVPIKSIGSPSANIGKFAYAILNKPDISLPGKTVVAYTEETTTGKLLQDWAEVTGNKASYVQTNLEEFSAIWPGWGLEMGEMMKLWDEVREKSWEAPDGAVTKEDLGLGNEKFVDTKAAYAEMNWAEIL